MSTQTATRSPAAALATLMSAKSVAVVGASARAENMGRLVVENLRTLAPDRWVAAVGPSAKDLEGIPTAESLTGLEQVPEAVVIAVATNRVVDVVREASELGVTGAVIFADRFAEAGAEGARLQDQIADLAQRHTMAVIGPNCQGLINFVDPLPLYSDRVDAYDAGAVALISESGSVITSLVNNKRGVRWSHAVSSGNEAATTAADLLEYFLDTPEVRVVCAFLETIRDPERFFAMCARAREEAKPVVICKTGRTDAAQRAATAHSGALASSDRLIDALFRRHGVIRTESLGELLETAKALSSDFRPSGRRMAALSGSGGHISLVLDEAEKRRLEFPPFSESTQATLMNTLGRSGNPLDYWGISNLAELLPGALEVIVSDPGIDLVVGLVDFAHGPTGRGPRANRLLDAWARVRDREARTLVLLDAVDGTPTPAAIDHALSNNVLVLSGLETGLRALSHLIRFSQPAPSRADPQPTPSPSDPQSLDGPEGIMSELGEATPGVNSGLWPLRLIGAAGVPVLETKLIARDEPLDLDALGMPFPLVAKAGDPGIAHRTAHDAVVLGISSGAELAAAVSALREVGDGSVIVQHQIESCAELLIGLSSSPDLGVFVVLGVGGVLTELTDDVVIRPVGLGRGEPEEMLAELRAHVDLQSRPGFADAVPAIVEAIQAVDRLGHLLGEQIESLDINPLMVTRGGCFAVDALVVAR